MQAWEKCLGNWKLATSVSLDFFEKHLTQGLILAGHSHPWIFLILKTQNLELNILDRKFLIKYLNSTIQIHLSFKFWDSN